MNLKRLRCLLFIMAFSMPLFAETPRQIDSFDDINDTNWVEVNEINYGDYMEQALVGGANEVYEGIGSMKFDFTQYVWPVYDEEVKRTFSPSLDFNDGNDWAITFWAWIDDANDSRHRSYESRLQGVSLGDASAFDRVGNFTVLPFKNAGWNKVIAPLRNFAWKAGDLADPIDPNEVDWHDINSIGLWASTPDAGDHNAIYIDDMQLELAPPQPARPYQVASCDDINDELWLELSLSAVNAMRQTPPGDPNFREGTGSMIVDYTIEGSDLKPAFTFIPALDFTDGNDWAITMWVWSDLVNDSEIHEMILHDVADNLGRYRVPRPSTYGWNKVTANIDEFLWEPGATSPGVPVMSADEACLDSILFIEMWTRSWPWAGNAIYLDDLRIEPVVEALSEAVVYNADYTPVELTIDGNASDWAGLVDSDIIDFDLQAVPEPNGNLHVQYRLAWDPNYLYILVEEQPGDACSTEAPDQTDFHAADTMYDSLALWFDFTNNRLAGVKIHISLWLSLGLSSAAPPGPQPPLIAAWTNATWPDAVPHDPDAVTNASVATSGTFGGANRVIEAKLKWSDLDVAIDSWFRPAGGVEAAIQPGYIFGCDPRLADRENQSSRDWTTEHGMAWFTGWPWDDDEPNDFLPTGRDTFSTDIRLVCSAGDLDFDCDVDFVDYAQFAAEWDETGCNNLNDFCNGADILTPMDGDVDLEDLGIFALRWLSP